MKTQIEEKQKVCGKDHSYNGWTNYETWIVNLWMDNNEGDHDYWLEAATEALKNAKPDPFLKSFSLEEIATGDLRSQLEDEIKNGDMVPDLGASMFADLLSGALSEVNFYEIAQHLIEAAKEEAR